MRGRTAGLGSRLVVLARCPSPSLGWKPQMSEPWWRNWGARYFEEDLNTEAEQENKQDRDSPRCSRCRTSTCGNKCWHEPRASVNWKLLTVLAVDRSRKDVAAEAPDVLEARGESPAVIEDQLKEQLKEQLKGLRCFEQALQ